MTQNRSRCRHINGRADTWAMARYSSSLTDSQDGNYELFKATINAPGLAEVVLNVVVRHHGLPDSIISDKGSVFYWNSDHCCAIFWESSEDSSTPSIRRPTANQEAKQHYGSLRPSLHHCQARRLSKAPLDLKICLCQAFANFRQTDCKISLFFLQSTSSVDLASKKRGDNGTIILLYGLWSAQQAWSNRVYGRRIYGQRSKLNLTDIAFSMYLVYVSFYPVSFPWRNDRKSCNAIVVWCS